MMNYHTAKRFSLWTQGIILTVVAIVMLFPILWMIASSLKMNKDIFTATPLKMPSSLTMEHYFNLFSDFHFGTSTVNSLVITLATVALSIIIGGLAAYGFARFPWRGSSIALAFLLIARMVTPASLVVPLYVIMQAIGLLNTRLSVILGVTALNLPFVIWILIPFFQAVPKEVEEAADLDGASPTTIFYKIVLPLAKPGLMTAIIYSFLAGWSDLLFPMTFITNEAVMPLTSSMLQMQTGYKIYWGELMAGGLLLTLPPMVLCFVLQKYLLQGMRSGY